MKITVRESSTVRPAEKTPSRRLWLSNLDQIYTRTGHISFVFPYINDGVSPDDFFDVSVLKESLSKTLVPFFPFAGRLAQRGEGGEGEEDGASSGRFEINCDGQGVLFVEAEIDVPMSDFGDFQPSPLLKLFVPPVDSSHGFSSLPLLLVQMTRFRCGGVCLGIEYSGVTCDGTGLTSFLTAWSNVARGGVVADEPFIDRTLLMARSPPRVAFQHPEYIQQLEQGSPSIIPTTIHRQPSSAEIFKLPLEKIKELKENTNATGRDPISYTTNEVLAAHAWRCVTVARGFEDQNHQTSLFVSVDGKQRFDPPLPAGYFGNCVFHAVVVASAAELSSEPLEATAGRIRREVKKIDDGYMRSVIDRLELPGDGTSWIQVPGILGSPQLKTTSWARMQFEQDFGWGKPIGTRATNISEGMFNILPLPGHGGENEVSMAIYLEVDAMEKFKQLFITPLLYNKNLNSSL